MKTILMNVCKKKTSVQKKIVCSFQGVIIDPNHIQWGEYIQFYFSGHKFTVQYLENSHTESKLFLKKQLTRCSLMLEKNSLTFFERAFKEKN